MLTFKKKKTKKKKYGCVTNTISESYDCKSRKRKKEKEDEGYIVNSINSTRAEVCLSGNKRWYNRYNMKKIYIYKILLYIIYKQEVYI